MYWENPIILLALWILPLVGLLLVAPSGAGGGSEAVCRCGDGGPADARAGRPAILYWNQEQGRTGQKGARREVGPPTV